MSTKKTTATSRSVKAKTEVPEKTQSTADRKAAEAQLLTLVDKFAPAHLPLLVAVRKALRKRLPTAIEVVYEYRDSFVISYTPNERGYEACWPYAEVPKAFNSISIGARNCPIRRNCCRDPASRRD